MKLSMATPSFAVARDNRLLKLTIAHKNRRALGGTHYDNHQAARWMHHTRLDVAFRAAYSDAFRGAL